MIRALHAVFDREPQAEPMFRVNAVGGVTMTVANGTLTLEHAGGVDAYALHGITIAHLIDAVEADGYGVPWQSDRGTSVGAHTLIEVTQEQHVRDTLDAYANPLWAHMDALGTEIGAARDMIAPMLSEVILPQSDGEWADLFGAIFGISRLDGEIDAGYTARIIAETLRARSSPTGILANIARLTGEDLTVREPWRELFTLGRSRLGRTHHLQGAPIYQYHTMQLVSDRGGVDWAAVLAEAEADRPAGTIMLGPATQLPYWFFAASNVAPIPVAVVADEARYWFSIGESATWDGEWDSRTWAVSPSEFPMHVAS